MPIVSDTSEVLALAKTLRQENPKLSALEAARTALRTFYDLTPRDGIWGGSEAAICMGYRTSSDDENLFEVIAAELAQAI